MNTVWRVFAYLKRYPVLALSMLACAIIGTLMVIVSPVVNERAFNEVIVGHHPGALTAAGLGGRGRSIPPARVEFIAASAQQYLRTKGHFRSAQRFVFAHSIACRCAGSIIAPPGI